MVQFKSNERNSGVREGRKANWQWEDVINVASKQEEQVGNQAEDRQ